MSTQQFQINQTLKVNNKSFTITNIEPYKIGDKQYYNLIGTVEGDPSFLAGKRTMLAEYLVKKGTGYTYNWNAK